MFSFRILKSNLERWRRQNGVGRASHVVFTTRPMYSTRARTITITILFMVVNGDSSPQVSVRIVTTRTAYRDDDGFGDRAFRMPTDLFCRAHIVMYVIIWVYGYGARPHAN